MVKHKEYTKDLLILFEGDDVEGKNKLIKEFNKLTNYEYFVLDTNFISNIVSDSIFNSEDEIRKSHVKKLHRIIKFFRKKYDLIIVYSPLNQKNKASKIEKALEKAGKTSDAIKTFVQDIYTGGFEYLLFIKHDIFSFRVYDDLTYPVDYDGVNFERLAENLNRDINGIIERAYKLWEK